jgi:hypothetical protein
MDTLQNILTEAREESKMDFQLVQTAEKIFALIRQSIECFIHE